MSYGTGFELLHTEQDWTAFKQRIALSRSWDASAVTWGRGPQEYPCLIAVKVTSQTDVTTAYVYLAHAIHLAQAAGLVVSSPGNVPGKPVRIGPQSEICDEATLDKAQDEFNVSVSAHVLSLVRLLVDTGIVTEGKYEEIQSAMLAKVDQWKKAATDAAATKVERSTLGQLFPRVEG